jgi:hypothetical protein
MGAPKRPASMPEDAVLMKLWVHVTERGFAARFHGASGLGVSRENPEYYDVIGRWICRELEAHKIGDTPDCRDPSWDA